MFKDLSLKKIFVAALLVVAAVASVVVYIHLLTEQRQAEREIIYIRARQMAAEQQRARTLQYQKRLQENRLNREFRQSGKVVSLVQE